ncbi:RHS repeat-associated core domain-containing protein [Ekhidna sp. To15]|uniref:RHS repeat-associated core domain-containing protein n=1 Tax=Ekhidna sp. To15 TaxID=3395267 RepID=UPI003F52453F
MALNNAVGRTLGPAKVLDIQTGDEVAIDVWARYKDAHGTANAFGSVLNSLLAMTGGTTTDGGVGEGLNNTLGSGGTNPFPVVGNPSSSSDAPDAYLAYLFFDANYNYVDALSSYQAVTDASLEAWAKLETPEKLVFDQPGYLFVYVANESQEDQEVYFDDLRIVHENSTASFKVTQVNEYYPYGMQTDKSWRADGYIDPQLMYQSGYASYDSLTGYYDFLFRSYDPALGRFFATDPLAGTTPSYSPYHANFNNPVMFRDPWGLSPRDGRLKDFGGFNNVGDNGFSDGMSSFEYWSTHMDGLGKTAHYGEDITRGLSVNQMVNMAWNNAPDGGAAKTSFSDGFPTGSIRLDPSMFDRKNPKSAINRQKYWSYNDGEKKNYENVASVDRAVFDTHAFMNDYLNASDFGVFDDEIKNSKRSKFNEAKAISVTGTLSLLIAGATFDIGIIYNGSGDWAPFIAVGSAYGLDASLGLETKYIYNNNNTPFEIGKYEGVGVSDSYGFGFTDMIYGGNIDYDDPFGVFDHGFTYQEYGVGASIGIEAGYTRQYVYTWVID